jgi:ATP-binding cassette subfamily F protein 3
MSASAASKTSQNQKASASTLSAGSEDSLVSRNKMDWKAQKEEQARLRKLENDLKKCEDRIAKLEERNTLIDAEMSKPEIATNSVKLQELANEQTRNNEELEILFERWEELAEEVNA